MKSVNCRKGTADCSKSLNLTLKMGSGTQSHDQTFKFRWVTKHKWTLRYEAHLWDGSCRVQGAKRNGKVYLGGYDSAEKAARAHDLAALKFWGNAAKTNFQLTDYEKEVKEMEDMTKEEVVGRLRRTSTGFFRGASKYRGVTRLNGKWQARIARVADNRELYLGTFDTEEEAAVAYDTATIKYSGRNNVVTNFDIRYYNVDKILSGESCRPTGNNSKRLKQTETSATASNMSASVEVDQHQSESPGQQSSPASGSDISFMPINQTIPSSSAGQIEENRVHESVVYIVDPSTGTAYYVPRSVIVPIVGYQSGYAPRILNMRIPNPYLQNLHVSNSQVDIAPTAQFQNVK